MNKISEIVSNYVGTYARKTHSLPWLSLSRPFLNFASMECYGLTNSVLLEVHRKTNHLDCWLYGSWNQIVREHQSRIQSDTNAGLAIWMKSTNKEDGTSYPRMQYYFVHSLQNTTLWRDYQHLQDIDDVKSTSLDNLNTLDDSLPSELAKSYLYARHQVKNAIDCSEKKVNSFIDALTKDTSYFLSSCNKAQKIIYKLEATNER
jgi:hypothetical protein